MSDTPLAAALRAERARRDIRQADAADHFGVHLNTLAGWEAGSMPASRYLPHIAAWLRLDDPGQVVKWIGEAS